MGSRLFSVDIAREVLRKLEVKSWTAYDSTDTARKSPQEIVGQGPITPETMRVERRYVVLPKCDNPRDLEEINRRMDELSLKLDAELPPILIAGRRIGWVGFRPYTDMVKVNTFSGDILSYDDFISALDTIVDAHTGK